MFIFNTETYQNPLFNEKGSNNTKGRFDIYHLCQKLGSLLPEEEGPKDRANGQDKVDEEDFFEVYLVADHETQAEPAGDSGGEEDVVVPDGSYRVGEVGACTE